MTKLRRSGSVDFGNPSMSNVLDMAKALCLACKQRSKPKRSFSLFQIKSCPSEEVYTVRRVPTQRMEGAAATPATPSGEASAVQSRSASGASATSAAARSLSMNSVSSEGSAESHVVEQEDIIVLTHDVRSFKEALGKLRRIFHPERDKTETMRVAAHERLGEVLRILRSILEKYPPIQSTELLMTAGTLIQQVKGYNYEDEKSDPSNFFDAIDQLALAFSSRVSEYLMGDLDSSSQPVPKTRSCDNLLSAESECDTFVRDKRSAPTLPPEEIDARLARLSDGVDLALRRAKVWSKYAKDVMTYVEKRCCAEAEHAKNLVKLAQTMRPILKEESFLPFQSIYYMALDQDFDNGQTSLKTCTVLQGHKFIEPLTSRRNEHERYRKQIKETWHREVKRTQESIVNLRKAKALYFQRQQEYEKAKESALKAENCEGVEASKIDKKRRVEDDALQKAMEAETTYKSCILEANERQLALEKMKCEVLQRVRELIYQCDQTMKAVTVGYFQLQSTLSAQAPVQFQTLCESSRLYEPGTQYMEFVKRLPQPTGPAFNGTLPFTFESYSSENRLDKSRKSNGSTESNEDILNHGLLESRLSSESREKLRIQQPIKAWGSPTQPTMGSDSDSMSSCPSNKSQDTSPAASPHISVRKIVNISSGDELETDHDNVDTFGQGRRACMSKAAETHTFRRLKTPSRCRECDSYVYFHGFECLECGLASHKKCLESLAIQCGRKRLPRKMTTFGVDLTTHAQESGEEIPYIVSKCITEVEDKGFCLKGIYRVSGVKSKVEKLCQSFENGAELVDLDGMHPNVVSNVLKLYLRQLPEPLLTYRLYPDFIKIAKDFPSQKCEDSLSSEGIIEELQKLVQRLPSVHLSTLKCLMHHLYRVSEHSNHNNMPPSNLGIVFGPTLLRTSEGSASLSSLIDTVHQTRVIELLITYAYEIFGPPPKSASSQKDDLCSHKKSKSARYRGGKQVLSRTVSGSSQTSDVEESQFIEVDHHRDGIADLDNYPIPGYLPTDKSQEFETSHQSSDVTHSSDDLLYSTITSDDDYPEIMLSDDSVFKKSPVLPCSLSQFTETKSNEDSVKPEQSSVHMKVQDARASLSSSPAVSEASHCSSLLRSTDDESVSDPPWKDGPVPPPRKNAPANLQLNQSFLHGAADRKQGNSSLSESSGVSSAASTSPSAVDTASQSDPGNIYTSTAQVTLAGQKSPSHNSRASTSSMTAELRRQFFELPPPLPSGTPPPTSRAGHQVEVVKHVAEFSESGAVSCCSESNMKACQTETSFEGRKDLETTSVLQGPTGRPRGSSLSHACAAESISSNTFYRKEDNSSSNSEIIYSLKMEATPSHPNEILINQLSEGRDTVDFRTYLSSKMEKFDRMDLEGKKRTEVYSVKQVLQSVELPCRTAGIIDSEGLNAAMANRRFLESTTEHPTVDAPDGKSTKGNDKLSLNRQPRFV
ncbi:rho GTPase-activating protein 45 [Trichonephila inaurata madagascariensis]|uniref:Rho GTPase-activating protein 45 n=1 Tax=Trichonephila inaurata madagascariensis TaxID=2747483 RepID=A0A8X7CKV5_9ARAC|nr:rho GTPase-activating protein 45 [Trichonephila inaurata madagascariensis]